MLDTVATEGSPRVEWSRSQAFPGVADGARLNRRMTLPRRATLLARDGKVLAESPPEGQEGGRSDPLGNRRAPSSAKSARSRPPAAGRSKPKGCRPTPTLAPAASSSRSTPIFAAARAGSSWPARKLLASTTPRAAHTVRTTISPAVQESAVTALGGQLGGVVAMKPSSGEILAVAGIGLDGLQPPGSTFKIVTVAGALGAHIATPHTVFPYATHATLDGVTLNNAGGEECGGSLELAFAVSCNSVFTPLGVKLGAPRLVAMAERFGFNQDPGVPGAARSSLPAADAIQGELAVGSTAIGQGEVLATPLQMATVAAAIGDNGHRPAPTFLAGAPRAGAQAVSPQVAHTVRHLMTEVVRQGTGTSAAIPGVVVAGKTGTAELKSSCTPTAAEREAHRNRLRTRTGSRKLHRH